jgi:hypothetical protein
MGRADRRGAYRILVENPEEKNHLEDPGVDGRIILTWILDKWNEKHDEVTEV